MPTYPERRAAAIAAGVAIMRKSKASSRFRRAAWPIVTRRDIGMDFHQAEAYLMEHERAFARYQELYPDDATADEFDGAVAEEIIQRVLRAEHESRISNGFRDYDLDTIIEWVIGRESPVLAAARPDEDAA